MRYPLIAFGILGAVVAGYATLANRAADRVRDELLRERAATVADLVARGAAAADRAQADAGRQAARADDLVADALAAQPEGPARLRAQREVLRRWLARDHVDRALLVDDRGEVAVEETRLERPDAPAPEPLSAADRGRIVRAAADVARGGAPPAGAAESYRRVGDRCLVLVRGAASLHTGDVLALFLEPFEGHPAVASAEMRDGAGGVLARQPGTPARAVRTVERDLELAGRPVRLRVGVREDGAPAARVPRAWLALLLAAGAVALAFVFHGQHAAWQREREVRARSEQDKRLTALGRLTAGVAHEIKNPLNAIRASTGRLRRHPEEAAQAVAAIDASAGAIAETVEDFVKLARDPRMRLQDCDAAAVLAEAVDQVRPLAAELGRRLEVDVGEGAGTPVKLDPARLQEALVNVLRNALQAARQHVAAALRREGDTLRFEIDDDGPGVPPDQRAEIFELFYTTKPEGTGLGLPLAHRVAEEHGGSLDVAHGPLGGARFTLRIPWR